MELTLNKDCKGSSKFTLVILNFVLFDRMFLKFRLHLLMANHYANMPIFKQIYSAQKVQNSRVNCDLADYLKMDLSPMKLQAFILQLWEGAPKLGKFLLCAIRHFRSIKKQICSYTSYWHQIEGEIRCNGIYIVECHLW